MSNPAATSLIRNLNIPLVSILINNYNYGHFLTEAIDSALNQTYPNIEVIVVDDGSTDDSYDVIKSYQDKIIPIFKENGGQASAFNTGFAASRGEIICFLDSDDLFLPEKVEEIANAFTAYADIGWCFHLLSFFGENQENFEPNKTTQNTSLSGRYDLRSNLQKGKLDGVTPRVKLNLATSAMCFRRSLLNQILPMTETIRITSDDYIKFIAFGLAPVFIMVKELSLQRIHDNNAYTLRTDNNKRKLEAKTMILTAYWMKHNFPLVMSKFSNNIFAVGMSLYLLNGGIAAESQEIVHSYLTSLNVFEKGEVFTRAFYNYIKYGYIKQRT
jgi:glycosyltransferase involved in cell wall biosynthesis